MQNLHKKIIRKGGRRILPNGVIINLVVINGESGFFVELRTCLFCIFLAKMSLLEKNLKILRTAVF